jgi:hypothetical protein
MAKQKPPPPPSLSPRDLAREQGYRTGYTQGATCALFASEAGATRKQLAAWVKSLQDWQMNSPRPPTWPPTWPEPLRQRATQ